MKNKSRPPRTWAEFWMMNLLLLPVYLVVLYLLGFRV